jgi:hypothetical protein
MQRGFNATGVKLATALFFLTLVLFTTQTFAQKKKGGLLGGIIQGAKDAKQAVKEVTGATTEVTNSVKILKRTWSKDTSRNIKYQQVPDYRTREEVPIAKKQKINIENGEFQNLSWQPLTKFDNQIFPSFIIGWATYKGTKEEDMGSSLGFYINTNLSNVVLKWEIESADKSYFNIDSGFIRYDDMRSTNMFMPRISWNFKTLTKHQTNAPVNVYFRLIDPNTGNKVEKLVNINLRSINDCLLCYNHKSFNYMFASYVNELHPEIDNILKKMLDTKMIDNVLGYQWGENYVDLQVAALWRVLHERGFQYSSITDNGSINDSKCDGVFAQSVRTFENSLSTNQANCVDGTVFMASVLKRIGIRPILVNVPGHCFLGYYMNDTTTTNIHYLETTLLSNKMYVSDQKNSVLKYKDVLAKAVPKEVKLSEINKAFYLQFMFAQSKGFEKIGSVSKKYGTEAIKLLDVSDLRELVQPIPYYN